MVTVAMGWEVFIINTQTSTEPMGMDTTTGSVDVNTNRSIALNQSYSTRSKEHWVLVSRLRVYTIQWILNNMHPSPVYTMFPPWATHYTILLLYVFNTLYSP